MKPLIGSARPVRTIVVLVGYLVVLVLLWFANAWRKSEELVKRKSDELCSAQLAILLGSQFKLFSESASISRFCVTVCWRVWPKINCFLFCQNSYVKTIMTLSFAYLCILVNVSMRIFTVKTLYTCNQLLSLPRHFGHLLMSMITSKLATGCT